MGTNYYLMNNKKEHVGKMSAAGYYCFDCKISLCKGGWEEVHSSESEWFDKCPKCGKEPVLESLENSSVGKQLGFNDKIEEKSGIRSCCSFTWATVPLNVFIGISDVTDECGRKYTVKEFKKLLTLECPIQFLDMIGEDFS